jgi:hypothetical protein
MKDSKELENRLQEQQKQLYEWFLKEKQRQQERCDSESSLRKCEFCNCWKNSQDTQ